MAEEIPLSLKVPEGSALAYQRAADELGVSRHKWMRMMLDAACGISKLEAQLERLKTTRVRDGKW
jgi:hypothetical protein